MKHILILAVAFVLFSITWSPTANADILKTQFPLPPDLEIIKPGNDIPPEIANFSGTWAGQWRKVPALYVVEKITMKRASVVYCFLGSNNEYKWVRYSKSNVVQIEEGKYMIEIIDGRKVTQFRLTPQPNYIQGIRWGFNFKYDNVPMNFQKIE